MRAGGAERVMSILANAWAAEGREVNLVTLSGPHESHYPLHPHVTQMCLDVLSVSHSKCEAISNNIRRIKTLRKTLRATRADVVVSFMARTNVLVCAALCCTAIPVVVSDRIYPTLDEKTFFWSKARALTYRRANCIVLQTSDVTLTLPESLHPRVVTIPNPVSANMPTATKPIRNKRILGAGRLVHQKGFDLLIRAFAALPQEAHDWGLEIYGVGGELGELQSLVKELCIENRVHWKGLSPDLPTEFSRGGIFVLSSRYEGFPNVLLEAMAVGLACIATNCRSGPADIINNGHNGLLVAENDPVAITDALNVLIADITMRDRLANNAIQIRAPYDVGRVLALWDEALINAVAHRAS